MATSVYERPGYGESVANPLPGPRPAPPRTPVPGTPAPVPGAPNYGVAPVAGTPDYTKLAEQTAQSNRDAAWGQTLANRPNQTDQYGNTLTWSQDPTTGQWTQQTQFGGAQQGLQDQQTAIKGGLLGQIGATGPLSTEGLPETNAGAGMLGSAGTFNMDPVGNSRAIQEATYGLLSPMRAQERAGEIQRLKNQGLTEDSPAFQRAIQRLDQGDTDAQLKSLLAGTTEYGNQFNRGLSANQSNFGQSLQQQQLASALRRQGFDERQMLHEQPMNDLGRFSGINAARGPEFSNFMSAANPGGIDYVGAASAQNSANIAKTNAENAAKAQKSAIWAQLGTAAAGNPQITQLVNQYGTKALDWILSMFSSDSSATPEIPPPYGDESDIPDTP